MNILGITKELEADVYFQEELRLVIAHRIAHRIAHLIAFR